MRRPLRGEYAGGTRPPAGGRPARMEGAERERAGGTPIKGIPRSTLHRLLRTALPAGALLTGSGAAPCRRSAPGRSAGTGHRLAPPAAAPLCNTAMRLTAFRAALRMIPGSPPGDQRRWAGPPPMRPASAGSGRLVRRPHEGLRRVLRRGGHRRRSTRSKGRARSDARRWRGRGRGRRRRRPASAGPTAATQSPVNSTPWRGRWIPILPSVWPGACTTYAPSPKPGSSPSPAAHPGSPARPGGAPAPVRPGGRRVRLRSPRGRGGSG